MLRKSLILLTLMSCVVILTGCGSSRTVRASSGKYESSDTNKHARKIESDLSTLSPASRSLLTEARSWIGTPYKYGGNDRDGIDCSGLVLQVYRRALDISLPRTSRDQCGYCTKVSPSALVPGDLVFFATGKGKKKVSHVGIFIGDNLMIHSSSSKGVIISDISSGYYTNTFISAGIVDRYHAMLDGAGNNPGRPSVEEIQISEVHIATVESPAGFSLMPTDKLPERKTAPADIAVRNDISDKTGTDTDDATVVKAVSQTTLTEVTVEPTVENARASVLNSLKEKNINDR